MADGYNNALYDQQTNDARYRYTTDRANNAYGRFLSQQRGSRQLGDLRQGFNRGLGGFKSQFGQRGFGAGVNSGVQQRAMQRHLGDFSDVYGRAQQDAQEELRQFDLNDADLDARLTNDLAGIEAQRQNDIANAALMIEALRPYLGSL